MRFGRSAIESNDIALFMLQQRRQKTRFIPLCDMRSQTAVRSKFFAILMGTAGLPKRPRALPGRVNGHVVD
jgi:hypothetical protein